MLYISYEISKQRYFDTQRALETILDEKEALFQRTQPKAATYDKEKVTGGNAGNVFDDYLIAKERLMIDKRLDEAKSLLKDRETLLKVKEAELRESKETFDRIYVAKFLDKTANYKIARLMHYSERQIRRILFQIRKALKDVRKCP